MQNDVKNAEADIINTLYNKIDANTFKFDKLEARVNAASNYVLIGDEYKAEIFVAGFSTTSNPQIWLGNYDSLGNHLGGPIDSTSVIVQNGVGYYTASPTSEGTTEWGGIIRIKDPANPMAPPKVFPFKAEYKSAKPAVVVSPDKMNVFYVGVDNPVSISVPGVAPSDIRPSISGGTITGSNGKYIVRVKDGVSTAVVSVAANIKGVNKPMGKGIEFRVKRVPNPEAEFAGKTGTATITEAQLKGGTMVTAKLDNFPFDLKFPIKSYVVSMTVNGKVVDAQFN
jgi:gliding motility-associated protein GldM